MVFSFTKLISAFLAFLTLFASTYEVNIEKDLSDTTEIIETTETEHNEDDNITGDDDIVTRIANPIPEDQLADVFAKAVAEFSDTLYCKTAEHNTDKSNLVLSPLSAYYALSLIANGAGGDTLNEIETALGNIPVEQLNEYLSALTDRLTSNDGSKVVVGNSTWTNSERFILSEKFIDTAAKYYDAEAVSLPFNNSALGKINGWVKEKTDGMIPSILNELDSKATMVLINTILFDGKWEKEYTKQQISDGMFYNYDGTASEAEFLFSEESGSYFTVNGGVGFTKKYKGGFRFTAVLPSGNIDDFMDNLDIDSIIDASFNPRGNVKTYIPKFEYEYFADLTNMLKSMGIESAMTNSADFYSLSADGETNSRIDSVIQKAKITLTEKGTKAAAATAIVTYGTTAMPPKNVPVIRLDRPFFYMIVDEAGIPLFVGTVYSLN